MTPLRSVVAVFCIALLGTWAIVATAISYTIFTQRDVFG